MQFAIDRLIECEKQISQYITNLEEDQLLTVYKSESQHDSQIAVYFHLDNVRVIRYHRVQMIEIDPSSVKIDARGKQWAFINSVFMSDVAIFERSPTVKYFLTTESNDMVEIDCLVDNFYFPMLCYQRRLCIGVELPDGNIEKKIPFRYWAYLLNHIFYHSITRRYAKVP